MIGNKRESLMIFSKAPFTIFFLGKIARFSDFFFWGGEGGVYAGSVTREGVIIDHDVIVIFPLGRFN